MTITLKPETEARLRERAKRDNADVSDLAEVLLSHGLIATPALMTPAEIIASYRDMAADKQREVEALEWAEGTLGQVSQYNFAKTNSSSVQSFWGRLCL